MLKEGKLVHKLRKASQTNTIKGKLVVAAYKFFKSLYVRAFINLFFSVAFAFQSKTLDFNTYRMNQIEFYSDKWHIIITIILMLSFNWLVIKIDSYQKYQAERIKCVKEVVNRETVINNFIGTKLYEQTKNISVTASYIPEKNDFKLLSYQDIATLICHNIYDAIKDSTGREEHQVSLMQKFKEKKTGKECIRMVSYGNMNQVSPGAFQKNFYLDKDDNYYHVKIFKDNRSGFFILKNANEVKKEFAFHARSEYYNICQYVAIPICCEEEGIVSLLQIDTTVEGLLGVTNEQITEFIKPFMAFVHILTVNYYKENLFKVISKKFDILREKVNKNQKGRSTNNGQPLYKENSTNAIEKDR